MKRDGTHFMLRVGVMIALLLIPIGLVAQKRDDTVRIVFTGDILLDRGVRQKIERSGIDALFTKSIDSLFHSSNFVIANFECPATKIIAPVNKRFIFRSEPEWLDALRQHGITHLDLANNHAVDQGREGLTDTYENILKAKIIPAGYGRDIEDATRPILLSTKPRNIYLLSSLQLTLENWSYLPDRPCVNQESINSLYHHVSDIRSRDPKAYIIVCLHWGIEHTAAPVMQQRYQAHHLIDAGADCLICHHTHTLQTIEKYEGKPIYYSIGNFIFDQHKPINTTACLVQINITKNHSCIKTLQIRIKDCMPEIHQSFK